MAQKNSDLTFIKKHYGENFAHLCRRLFPSFLEHKGLLSEVLTENIYASHSIYDALNGEYDAFTQLIQYKSREKLNFICSTSSTEKHKQTASPFELIKQAGYKLYECKTYRDTLKFKKYYTAEEQLCTFDDKERTATCHVFFAVKEDAQEIKRAKNPEREDEYGTSVISIQIPKNPPHMVSIKNRYNHTVENPDATFSNNLENIKSGLTESLSNYCNMEFDFRLPVFIPGFVHANDGRFYPYNEFINNIHYCPDNIIIHQGRVLQYEKEKFDLVDHFLICKQDRVIRDLSQKDSFTKTTEKIDKIEIVKHVDKENSNKVTKEIRLISHEGVASIVINSQNQMIEYRNPYLKYIPDNFFKSVRHLKVIDLPEVKEIGNNCLRFFCGDTLSFENVENIGDDFAMSFDGSAIILPKVKKIGEKFCTNACDNLNHIDLSNIQEIKRIFLINLMYSDPSRLIDFSINPEMQDLYRIFKARNSCLKVPLLRQIRINKLRDIQEDFCSISHRASNFQQSSSNLQT